MGVKPQEDAVTYVLLLVSNPKIIAIKYGLLLGSNP